jgi:hypothetical protein
VLFPGPQCQGPHHGLCSDLAGALKVLEWAGVLTWQNRIARIQVRELDLFGRWVSRWRVIRTSNAYVFRDPHRRSPASRLPSPKIQRESGIKVFHACTGSSAGSGQRFRANSAPARQRDRRKIALEGSGGPNPEGCDSAHDLS